MSRPGNDRPIGSTAMLVHLSGWLGSLASSLLVPIFPLFLFSRGFAISGIAGLMTVPILAGILAGNLASRSPETFARPPILAVLYSIPVVILPLYGSAQTPSEYAVLLVGLACAGALAGVGSRRLVETSGTRPDDWVTAHPTAAACGIQALGTLTGGLLGSLHLQWPFLAAAGASLCAAILVAWVATHASPVEAPSQLAHDLHRTSVRLILGFRIGPLLRWNFSLAGLHGFLFNVSLGMYPFYFPVVLLTRGVPIALVGAVLAIGWIAYAIAIPLGTRVSRHARWKVMAAAAVVTAGAAAASIGEGSVVAAVGGWTALSTLDGLSRPAMDRAVAHAAPSPYTLHAAQVASRARLVARLCAPFFFVLLVRLGGFPIAFLVAGGLMAISFVPLLFLRTFGAGHPAVATPSQSGEVSAA